jgi:NAD(P)-dependent dehydrogenase (short-subunit alcohol dehydrogenase family)
MVVDRFNLEGKVAIVIGGTGGLGSAICSELSAAGADLLIGARDDTRLSKLADGIRKEGTRVLTHAIDVTDQNSVKKFVEQAILKLHRIDVLVNCVGMTIKKPIVELALAEWQKVIDVNLTGVFLCSQAVVPYMRNAGGGKIVNFCSMGSYVSIRTSAAYCAAKGGLLQLTKVMAMEWAPWNIQVNAVAPGFFDTPLASGIKSNAESYNKLMMKSPMKRLGMPDELVSTIIYLASSASDFVTGVCIPVDGGFLVDGI